MQATIKAAEKSLPGDYMTTISASAPEVHDNDELRMTVETSVLWGWVGVLIILAVSEASTTYSALTGGDNRERTDH